MSERNQSSKTMKIDIPPDMLKYWDPSSTKPPPEQNHIRIVKKDSNKVSQAPSLENKDLQELFQGVYDAAFLTDIRGAIIDVNMRTEEFFGYSRDEFLGNSITGVILGSSESVIHTICENLENGRFTLLQAQCSRKDGTHFPTEISTSRLSFSESEHLCFFIRDISERRAAENALQKVHDELADEVKERRKANLELQEAIDQLRKHDEAKTQFVSNVSHELKTPLTSIMYMAGNMLKGIVGTMPEKSINYLDMIREDCNRLKRTVDDILDISRIEAETLNLNHIKLSFSRFIEQAVESLRVQAESEGITINLSINCLGFVECDPQKLERAIYNVVKNAIKFNVANGTIDVGLNPAKDPGFLELSITDSGIGIESEHISHVTERYYRVGEYVSGAGLGLCICNDLLQRHHGRLEITSPPPGREAGTQVCMYIPVAEPSMILIIDDEEGIRTLITEQLLNAGYNVVTADSGETALTIMQEAKPELILLDWGLPGMNGGIAITRIKSNDSLSEIPIIVITASIAEQSKREILQGLGVPVLLKPWKEEDLLDRIDKVLIEKEHHEG